MNYKSIFKEYSSKGYAKIGNVIDVEEIQVLIKEINNTAGVITYFDNNSIIRRIEKFYNKGIYLSKLNDKITKLLSDIFSEEYVIFKDKYNSKPPGGEGFYAHYDGIFHWVSEQGKTKNGWYEYSPEYVNVLIAFDDSDDLNGTIELAKINDFSFDVLLSRTKNNGTPEILEEIAENLKFEKINLNRGDAVIFSHKCPHRSGKNNSGLSRRILYYTYNEIRFGNNYNRYFEEKLTSNPGLNIDKALSSK